MATCDTQTSFIMDEHLEVEPESMADIINSFKGEFDHLSIDNI